MNKKKLLIILVVLVVILIASFSIYYYISIYKANKSNDASSNTTKESTSQVFEGSYPIVDTGQTVCSNADSQTTCPNIGQNFYGQDAQYAGNTFRYQDNGDRTVTDRVTGLIWQQDSGEKIEYYEAIEKVRSFKLAGYTDWRVPTIKELYSLINFMGTDPSQMNKAEANLKPFIDDDSFVFRYGDTDSGDRVIDSQWVTDTIYESKVFNGEECFFGVNFADGRIKCYPTQKGKGYYAIYVRGESYGINDFKDNGDSTISDKATGLMWQQNDNGQAVNWKDSLSYCESLSLADYDDWRLPNTKELHSIVDYSRSPDTTNSAAINSIFETTKITNEKGEDDYPYFWSSTTHLRSNGSYNSAVYIAFGRALGYMNNQYLDVHGAGAQRSDPKSRDPDKLIPVDAPQGDIRRVYNYARCVRGGEASTVQNQNEPSQGNLPSNEKLNSAPQEAIKACKGKTTGSSCSFIGKEGKKLSGVCNKVLEGIACVVD